MTYAKVKSDTCTITSNTVVTSEFTKGMPLMKTAISPVLSFVRKDGTFAHNAKPAVDATLINPLTVISSTSGLESSYSGGLEFKVEAAGLT